MAALEVVEHHDLVAARASNWLDDDRADVAGAAGDEQLHRGHLAWDGISGHSRHGFRRPRIERAVTDALDSLAIGEFEHVAVGPSVVLLRVKGRSSGPRPGPEWRPALIADHGSGPERFEPLPSPPDPEGVLRAAYSVPAALIAAGPRFSLELPDGETIDLPAPTPGTPRRAAGDGPTPARDREPPAESSESTRLDLRRELAEARDRATRLQGENETMTSTLEELEIWRAELERRLADTTTELAETRRRLADAHAAAAMDALVARAEAEALEQAAHELTEAAAQARSPS